MSSLNLTKLDYNIRLKCFKFRQICTLLSVTLCLCLSSPTLSVSLSLLLSFPLLIPTPLTLSLFLSLLSHLAFLSSSHPLFFPGAKCHSLAAFPQVLRTLQSDDFPNFLFGHVESVYSAFSPHWKTFIIKPSLHTYCSYAFLPLFTIHPSPFSSAPPAPLRPSPSKNLPNGARETVTKPTLVVAAGRRRGGRSCPVTIDKVSCIRCLQLHALEGDGGGSRVGC